MTRPQRRIVVVGATSAIAGHMLRSWLSRGDASVVLVGRDQARLDAVRADLAVRFPASSFASRAGELVDPASIQAAVAELSRQAPDLVLIAHASPVSQGPGQGDLIAAGEQLMVTGVSPALWMEAFADRMASGTIAVIGSVAGDRGRRGNYLYGAGKALIERVAQGLQHRFAGTGLRIVLIKPGPTRTPLTAHLAAAGARLADVSAVAGRAAHAVDRGRRTVYAPARWRAIMAVVRSIPAPLFNRLDL